MKELNAMTFSEETNKELPTVVDFWAPWCGPCRMMTPVVAQLAEEYDGKALVGKVNVDEQPDLAAAFGVASIPMFVVLKGGKVTATKVGAMPKASLEALLR